MLLVTVAVVAVMAVAAAAPTVVAVVVLTPAVAAAVTVAAVVSVLVATAAVVMVVVAVVVVPVVAVAVAAVAVAVAVSYGLAQSASNKELLTAQYRPRAASAGIGVPFPSSECVAVERPSKLIIDRHEAAGPTFRDLLNDIEFPVVILAADGEPNWNANFASESPAPLPVLNAFIEALAHVKGQYDVSDEDQARLRRA